jgi:hypothetical protein
MGKETGLHSNPCEYSRINNLPGVVSSKGTTFDFAICSAVRHLRE